MKRSLYLAIATVAVATVCARYALSSCEPETAHAAAPQSTAEVPMKARSTAEIEAIEHRLAILEAERSAPAPAGSAAAPAGGPTPRPAETAPPHQLPTQVELDQLLASQTRDVTWARENEKTLRTSFAEAFPDDSVREATCASSLCRVVVEHSSPKNAAEFVNRFWTALPEDFEGASYDPVVGENGQRTTVLHPVRRGFRESGAY